MRLAVIAVIAALVAGLIAAWPASAPPKQAPAPVARRHVQANHPSKRPPQFVISSYDGSGGARLWKYWRGVATRAHAHFTFFVSGVYLVDWAHHERYAPPENPRGTSAIGFAPDLAWVAAMRAQIALGYRDGHEIGTHYNGHFCGAGGVGTWTAADWSDELDQFDRLLFGNGHKLPFRPAEIVGGRTPCLEGNLDALYPVLAKRGFRYDASRTALLGSWPAKRDGIWSFPLLELPFIGHTFRVVSMDYNFMANQMDESPARIENETYRTLWNAFRASYLGNRAPLSLGNHFETWESWAYDHALTRFLLRACRLREVRCSSFAELANWLDAQSPKRLARFRSGRFPHARAAGLNRA
ncbi:MAG: hypothetical protein ACJ757_15145 [Gaiellaceae bacterium]